jgi:hypothetical protein
LATLTTTRAATHNTESFWLANSIELVGMRLIKEDTSNWRALPYPKRGFLRMARCASRHLINVKGSSIKVS